MQGISHHDTLNLLVDLVHLSPEFKTLLEKLLAFEVVPVDFQEENASIAVILSHRNPNYLLSRLKYPYMPEDVKYLPLVFCLDPQADGKMFYHYRQFKLSEQTSLLCYLPVDLSRRSNGFKCYQKLNLAICGKGDSRIDFRASCITKFAVAPILKKLQSPEYKILDLGAGSGELVKSICIESAKNEYKQGRSCRFSVTLVDVDFHKPERHAVNRHFFQATKDYVCRRSDFREWIDLEFESSHRESYDIVLMCRLLNNTSDFEIEQIDDWLQVSRFNRKRLDYRQWQEERYLPHNVLASDLQKNDLHITNARIPLLRGHTYSSASLSKYYQGISMLQTEPMCHPGGPPIFYLVRRLPEQRLIQNDGRSLIEKTCRISRIVVVEDVDLDAATLRSHLRRFKLNSLAAFDLTDRKRMQVSQLFCVCQTKYAEVFPAARRFF